MPSMPRCFFNHSVTCARICNFPPMMPILLTLALLRWNRPWVVHRQWSQISTVSQGKTARAYWTTKQRSRLSGQTFLRKVPPILAHSCHPCRPFLRRIERAVSLLVHLAAQMVKDRRRAHVPTWQLHSGCRDWLALLTSSSPKHAIAEYDVEGCFLNTSESEVLLAVQFWLESILRRTRGQLHFSICKDGKKGNHVGRSNSCRY